MLKKHLEYLVCPKCEVGLTILEETASDNIRIKSGKLQCPKCKTSYEITNNIPRFVPANNYANNFGLEWGIHSKTQYDSYSGTNLSEKRFFEETKWNRNLRGQIILEAGSGSGRFTEHAATTEAMIVSMDYSDAVEANYASNGNKENVLIVQGDIYAMPFKKSSFDKLLCIGVLQ
ncbi:MAG: 2-polyprenyl-3-methyl-5-hydroxy-6-metoxy-1,4-benzoquinol methylase, partial [uncultured bacterium]